MIFFLFIFRKWGFLLSFLIVRSWENSKIQMSSAVIVESDCRVSSHPLFELANLS